MTSKIVVNNIEADAGVSTVFFNSDIGATGGTLSVDGNLNVDGVITYEDVTSVDSVGIITAQAGIHVTGGVQVATGSTITGSTNTIIAETAGLERLRIDSSGRTHLGDRSYNNNNTYFGLAQVNICGPDNPPTSMTRAGAYLDIGGTESLVNSMQYISFGFASTHTYKPAFIGYQTINAGAAEYGDIFFATRNVISDTQPTERLRIASDGKVGIGTNSPATQLHVRGSSVGSILRLTGNSNTAYGEIEGDNVGNLIFNADPGNAGNSSTMRFRVDGTERLRITSGGNVLIGTTTGDTSRNSTSTRFPVFQVSSSWSSGRGSYSFTTTDDYPVIFFNSNASYSNGSGAGTLVWSVKDGSGDYCNTAQISSSIDGTPGNDDSPGNLKFFTTPNSSASPSERLRITSDGQIFAGSATSSSIDGGFTNLQLWKDSATEGGSLTLVNNQASTATGTCSISVFQNYRNAGEIIFGRENANNWQAAAGGAASYIAFKTNSSGTHAERLRITSEGRVGVGFENPRTELDLDDGQLSFSHRTDYSIRFYNGTGNNWSSINNPSTNDGTNASALAFKVAQGEALRITSDGHVLKPKMAAAAAGMSAGTTTLSSFGGSWVQLTVNYQKFDNNGNFNPSNYRFTAPETGYYIIGCSVQLENGSGSGNRWMYIYPHINGAQTIESQGGNVSDFDPAVSYYFTWNYSALYKLTKNDYVDWRYRGNLTSINLKGQNETIFYFYQVG